MRWNTITGGRTSRTWRAGWRSLALVLFAACVTIAASGQNECANLGNALRSTRDQSGFTHQIECVNPATGALIFPGVITSFSSLSINGQQLMNSVPVGVFFGYSSNAGTSWPAAGLGKFTVPAGHTITIIQIDAESEATVSGCATAAVVDVFDGANSVCPVTFASGTAFNSTCSQDETAGTLLTIRGKTNAATCTTAPSFEKVNVTFIMH